MSVLERSELEASPLADLHAIADQLGLDGFRRLRKSDLIDAILDEASQGGGGAARNGEDARARDGGDRQQAEHDDGEDTRAGAAEPRRRRTAGRTARARVRRAVASDRGDSGSASGDETPPADVEEAVADRGEADAVATA